MASTSAAASSSQEIVEYGPFSGTERSRAPPRLFDVFINHRGPDVKDTLAFQIYNSIKKIGFLPFLDSQEMELGDSIPSTLKNAIYSASVHIAIFSKGYAQSAWCLAELVLMLQTGVKIIPVFYDVMPSDLRHIKKGVYADAFATYKEKGRYLNKLKEWKQALHSVSLISGYECSKHNDDHDKLCKDIASAVLKELERKIPLNVADHSVGLDEIVEDFEKQCNHHKGKQNVQIIGIFGMGGCGKTTLAKEFFNRKSSEYDGSSFLFDVREASVKSELPCLQIKLLKDLFGEDPPKFQSTDEGTSYLRYRLGRGYPLRFLIVLDDINHMDQLNALVVTDSMNCESLVIVTTRDERVLMRAAITVRYKMKEMNQKHSRELFCWHAFFQPYPSSGYNNLVESFLKKCGGLPLSLKVLGQHVSGTTDKRFWQLELEKVRNTLPEDIKQILKISYDALDREEKEIFMDIACFFIGKLKSTAIRIWEGLGWKAEHALETLKDKCLVVEIEAEMTYFEDKWLMMNKSVLKMHDHLRDLGVEMADQQSHPRRLWCPQDLKSLELKGFRNILAETNGHSFRCFHSFFESSIGGRITYFLGNSEDCAETSTALLSLELYLHEHQVISIPSWIPLQNLQRLQIVVGHLKRLWHNNAQAPFQLKDLVLQQILLEDFPNSLGMLNQLQNLVLIGKSRRGNLMQITGRSLSETLRKLTNLKSLVLCNLISSGELALKNSGESTTLDSPLCNLQTIQICDVQLACKVSISGEHCPNLLSVHLESMENLVELDLTLVNTLNSLTLSFCGELKTISGSFGIDSKLAILYIQKCKKLEGFPSLECLNCLERITIDGCQKLHGMIGIEELERLKYLHFSRGGLSKVSVRGQHSSLTLRACRDFKTLSGSFDLADLSCLDRIFINGDCTLRNIKRIELEGLKYLHISGREGGVSKLSICGEHWPSLECLHLESMENLIEVDLTLVKTLNFTVKSCRRLEKISGRFNMATKLAIMKIEECPKLEELPSLRGLSCVERITIHGCLNLWSINNIEKLARLKTLHLSRGGEVLSKVSISGEHFPSLESVCLESMENLIKVDLTLVKTLKSFTLRSCRRLKTISGSFDMATKFAILKIEECPKLDELPILVGLSFLERITINGCLNLQSINGIENLERLKTLHLSGGGGGLSKVSHVSAERWPSLESVHLASMENLFEVDLTLVKTLNSLTLRSCRRLRTVSGSFDMATKLAILKIEECPALEKLPSLVGLSCLERITIKGCMNLQSVNGIENLERLKTLHLSGGGGLSKVSHVSAEHWPSLESVHLESMENLFEVDLTLVKTLNFLTLRSCRRLKTITGSFDMATNIAILNIQNCCQLEEFPSLAGLSCLESIHINGCWNLPNERGLSIKGIERLKGLKSLHLSDGRGLSKVSFSGEYCPNLESLHLECMENLIEVDLNLVKTLNSVTLRSCRKLKKISGSFEMSSKLAVLNVEKCFQLEEMPSLTGLTCLERININGFCNLWNIEGIKKLGGLKYLHFSSGGVSKVSVSGEEYPSLESVCLESMKNLIEVDLTLVKTLISLTLRSCRKLKAILVSFDLAAKLAILNIRECPELEELQILASQSCLGKIFLDGCWKLQNITGIEEFGGLKYLYLSGGYKVIHNCIPKMQSLPSEITVVIGKAYPGSVAGTGYRSFVVSLGNDAVSEIYQLQSSGAVKDIELKTQRPLSAVIVCAVFEISGRFGKISVPHPPNDLIETKIGRGIWMVTIVIAGQKDVNHAQQDISKWIPRASPYVTLKERFIVTVNKGKRGKALGILKQIIAFRYKGTE